MFHIIMGESRKIEILVQPPVNIYMPSLFQDIAWFLTVLLLLVLICVWGGVLLYPKSIADILQKHFGKSRSYYSQYP